MIFTIDLNPPDAEKTAQKMTNNTQAQVSFPALNSSTWIDLYTSSQVYLVGRDSTVNCGHSFSFHSYLVTHYDSGNARNKIFFMLAVRNVSISAKSGLRFAVTIGYDLGDGSPGYCPWQPAAVSVESINNQSVISFALPSLSYNSVRVKQVTVKVEQVDPPQASSIPAAIQQLRTNALLATMDNPTLCDCSLLPKDALAKPIHVSRAVLAHASTYFVTMFSGPWADAGKHDKPIELGWTVSAVLPSLIHIYSGWVVGQPLPPGKAVKELVAKHGLDVTAFTLHQLLELMDLAQMLELPLLVQAVNKEMTKLLAVQLVKVSSDVVDMCKKVKEIGNEAEE